MPARITRPLLVLACGRSGTLYTSKVFKAAGYDLGHERVGSFGSCSMYMVPRVTRCDIVNIGQKTKIHDGECRSRFNFGHVWHQVRHPLPTIDSLAKCFSTKVRVWTGEELGVPLPGSSDSRRATIDDKLHWAMNYWVRGNEAIEPQAEWCYRVEDFPWEEMLTRLGLEQQDKPNVGATTNRGLRYAFKSKEQIKDIKDRMYDTSWATLRNLDWKLYAKIHEMTERYGYEE